MPETVARPRWLMLGISAAVAAWMIAVALAIDVSLTFRRLDAETRRLEQRHAEIRTKLFRATAVRRLEARAKRGSVRAMRELADAYRRGSLGLRADPAQSFAWNVRAAEAKSIRAMLAVAKACENGEGTAKNVATAVAWYTRAAERGDATAARRLGDLHFEGTALPVDYAVAFRWYQRCPPDDREAWLRVGAMHEYGRGTSRDLPAAFYTYARLAESGDAEAQNKVAGMLFTGIGTARDPAAAVGWYRRAAEKGDPAASANLGFACLVGLGVEKNVPEGLALMEQGVAAGDPHAMCLLSGVLLYGGAGIPANTDRGLELLRRSADLKYADAQIAWADLHLNGTNGAPKNEAAAYGSLEAWASQGGVGAKVVLAKVLVPGLPGVPPNWSRARQLAFEAANAGSVFGLSLHAALLRNGIGGPADLPRAAAEFETAAAMGDPYGVLFFADMAVVGQAPLAPARAALSQLRERLNSELAAPKGDLRTMADTLDAELANLAVPSAPAAESSEQRNEALPSADRFPSPLIRKPPRYPQDLRWLGVSGTVTVDFIVDQEGIVRNPYALTSTLPGFEKAAVIAVTQWRFTPGIAKGKPVNIHMQVPIVFVLDDDSPRPSS